MKKILLTFVGIFAISTIIIAQNLKPNIIGIRAGLNSATIYKSYESLATTLDARISFNVGA